MEKTVTIEGMKCDGCVKTVKEKFEGISGVTSADVSLDTHNAKISATREVSQDELNKSLADTKFKVIG